MQNKTSYFKTPQPYRNLSAFIAVVGTLLLWRHGPAQGSAAFAAILLLFAGALIAIGTVFLALRRKDSATVIQSLLLMLWQIGFPLVWMAKLYHQAV
ncbi:TPA: hypothetical protein ACFP41_001115 [Neisseria weaveri]